MNPETGPEAAEEAAATSDTGDTTATGEALVDEELLVEEISIDGMCGVY